MENLPSHQSAIKEWSSQSNISIDTLKKIQQGIKLEECTDAELSGELFKIYNIIGLRVQHYPSELQDQLIFRYIREKYGHKFKAELFHAFELGLFGKLDIDDINPYDQFSVAYLVKVMEAYRKYCNSLIINHTQKEEMKELPGAKMTKQQMQEELDYYKGKSDLSIFFVPYYLYDYMVELGHCGNDDWEKNKWKACMLRKNELYSQCQNKGDRDSIRALAEFSDSLDAGVLNGSDVIIVTSLAKKILVHKWLKS